MKNQIIQSVKILVLGIMLAGGVSYAWVSPGNGQNLAPQGNVPGPINNSSNDQYKSGQLFIGYSNPLSTLATLSVNGVSLIDNLFAVSNSIIAGKVAVGSGSLPGVSLDVTGSIVSTPLAQANNTGVSYNAPLCADTSGNIILCPPTVTTLPDLCSNDPGVQTVLPCANLVTSAICGSATRSYATVQGPSTPNDNHCTTSEIFSLAGSGTGSQTVSNCSFAPDTFCATGELSSDEPDFPGIGETVTWTCSVEGQTIPTQCSANRLAPGAAVCGTAHEVETDVKPENTPGNLCATGTAYRTNIWPPTAGDSPSDIVTLAGGMGPWVWSCRTAGQASSDATLCHAPRQLPKGLTTFPNINSLGGDITVSTQMLPATISPLTGPDQWGIKHYRFKTSSASSGLSNDITITAVPGAKQVFDKWYTWNPSTQQWNGDASGICTSSTANPCTFSIPCTTSPCVPDYDGLFGKIEIGATFKEAPKKNIVENFSSDRCITIPQNYAGDLIFKVWGGGGGGAFGRRGGGAGDQLGWGGGGGGGGAGGFMTWQDYGNVVGGMQYCAEIGEGGGNYGSGSGTVTFQGQSINNSMIDGYGKQGGDSKIKKGNSVILLARGGYGGCGHGGFGGGYCQNDSGGSLRGGGNGGSYNSSVSGAYGQKGSEGGDGAPDSDGTNAKNKYCGGVGGGGGAPACMDGTCAGQGGAGGNNLSTDGDCSIPFTVPQFGWDGFAQITYSIYCPAGMTTGIYSNCQ